MSAKVEYTLEKKGWEPGPWIDEPDQGYWLDAETNYPCLIVRDDMVGTLNGYVGVGRDHPAYRKKFSRLDLNYSGRELTFSGFGNGLIGWPNDTQNPEIWWFGYDNAHVFQRRNFTKEMVDLHRRMAEEMPGLALYPSDQRDLIRGKTGHYTTFQECEKYCAMLAAALKGLEE